VKLPHGSVQWAMRRCGDLFAELGAVIGKPLAAATMKLYGTKHERDGASSSFCCTMREKYILGIVAEAPNIPTPPDVVDFIDFDTLLPDGRQMLEIKYCPFCGVYVKGPKRLPR